MGDRKTKNAEVNGRKHSPYFICCKFILQCNWICEIWSSHSSAEKHSSLLECLGLLDTNDGRTKILRNVDNYQSRRRNVSENFNLIFVCYYYRSVMYMNFVVSCFCVILCCILATRPERTNFTRFSAFAARPISLTAYNTVLAFLSL